MMIGWTIFFMVIAAIAAVFSFGGLGFGGANVSFFLIGLALTLVSLFLAFWSSPRLPQKPS